MRSPADFLGLVAYLTVMYGRLPDRELLAAAYADGDAGGSEGESKAESDPRAPLLRVVEPSTPEPATGAESPGEPEPSEIAAA